MATAMVLSSAISSAADSTIAPVSGATPLRTLPPNMELRYDLPVDVGVTVGGGALMLTLELLSPKIAPRNCRWCDRDANGQDTLNGFDASIRRALRWSDTSSANRASSVFSYGLAPLAGVGIGALIAWHDDRIGELPIDLLVVAEAAVIAVNVNQVSKLAFARERPDIHFRTPAEREARKSAEDNLSFYSGHTTLSFALATAAGTVASMRQHRLAPVMWITGMALAAASGYLRIAADRHYATDVIGGAVFGSAIGFGVPYFAHHPTATNLRLTALETQGGSGLLLTGLW